MNNVEISGKLFRDSEYKQLSTGTLLLTFSVAVDQKPKKDGKYPEPMFVDVKAWAELAETTNHWLLAGARCKIRGALSQEQWIDKTSGKKRTKLLVTAFEIVGDDNANG